MNRKFRDREAKVLPFLLPNHFRERRQKAHIRSRISVSDLPLESWKRVLRGSSLPLTGRGTALRHSAQAASARELAGFGVASRSNTKWNKREKIISAGLFPLAGHRLVTWIRILPFVSRMVLNPWPQVRNLPLDTLSYPVRQAAQWVLERVACFHQLPSELVVSQNVVRLTSLPYEPSSATFHWGTKYRRKLCYFLTSLQIVGGYENNTGLNILIKIKLGSQNRNSIHKRKISKPKKALLRFTFTWTIYNSRHYEI